jgi:hypothetical protein
MIDIAEAWLCVRLRPVNDDTTQVVARLLGEAMRAAANGARMLFMLAAQPLPARRRGRRRRGRAAIPLSVDDRRRS